MKNLYKVVRSEIAIVLTLCGLILLGIFLWLCSEKTEEFGLNFTTEIIGVGITIIIIDRLIKKREERKNIPHKLAAYEDVRMYTTRYISFWVDCYIQSVPEELPESIDSFFSNEVFEKIFTYLNLDSEPNVFPKRKWWDWIVENAKEFNINGEKILNRHPNLDPLVFRLIHQVSDGSLNNLLMRFTDLRKFYAYNKKYEAGMPIRISIEFSPADFQAVIGLLNWCKSEYAKLKRFDEGIFEVYQYDSNAKRDYPPKCMVPPEVLESNPG